MRNTAIEFFSERNNAKTYALLSANSGYGYYLGKSIFEGIENLVDDDINHIVRDCKNIMKRCTNDINNPKAESCNSDSDCPGNQNCTFAQHKYGV